MKLDKEKETKTKKENKIKTRIIAFTFFVTQTKKP